MRALLCALPWLFAGAALGETAAAPNIMSVPGAGPYYALTFDAHAEPSGALELLTLLRERHVRATLFVTGRFATNHPEIVRQAVADGHEIGNHTLTHPHLTTWAENRRHITRPEITREVFQQELLSAAAAIREVIGASPAPYWRAPYGEHNATIRRWAFELGLAHVDWTRGAGSSLDALDWVGDSRARNFLSPEAMARRLLNFEKKSGVSLAGSIILMHLGNSRPDLPLLEALPIFLDEADRRSLHPASVGELLHRARSPFAHRATAQPAPAVITEAEREP